jgi:carbonic anhydrase
MSCNVPINIVRQQTDKCNLKCKLWYNYGNSSCLLQNSKDQLILTYDGASDVMFNSVPYKPTEIRIFKPSIHSYDGTYAEAELIIVHSGGQNGLLICVPITISETSISTKGSTLLEDIITNATDSTEVVTMNIQDFNANNLIPKSSYFSYAGPIPYAQCNPDSNAQYVVFHYKQGSISVSQETMDNLGKIIHDAYIPIYEGKSFFNEKGTIENGFAGDGQIYIDCQPTDEDSEIVYQQPEKQINLDWLWASLFIIIGLCIAWLLGKISTAFWGTMKSVSKNNIPSLYGQENVSKSQ